MSKIYKMGAKERRKIGMLGHKHVEKNYNFQKLQQKWVEIIDEVLKEKHSYNGIRFKEVA